MVRRPVEGVDHGADNLDETAQGPHAAQGSPPLHESQAVSATTKHAQTGVDPLERFQPAYAVHRGDA
jgi:hypothetical protein